MSLEPVPPSRNVSEEEPPDPPLLLTLLLQREQKSNHQLAPAIPSASWSSPLRKPEKSHKRKLKKVHHQKVRHYLLINMSPQSLQLGEEKQPYVTRPLKRRASIVEGLDRVNRILEHHTYRMNLIEHSMKRLRREFISR
ncbi:UNVERIFIED_CONTAM: hypothetical protein K2H54_036323 [Gekko kuhli]